MAPDYSGWLLELNSQKPFWCVARCNALYLHDAPDTDEPPRDVLTLAEFQFQAAIRIADAGTKTDATEQHGLTATSFDFSSDGEYSFELQAIATAARKHFHFVAPSETAYLDWRRILAEETSQTFKLQAELDYQKGQSLASIPSEIGSQDSVGETCAEGGDHTADFHEALRTRKSENLTDDLNSGGSTSGDCNSVANLDETDSTETKSRHSGDSACLGTSQDFDEKLWNETNETEYLIISDDDLDCNSSCLLETSDATPDGFVEGPRQDQSKTIIRKVSNFVQKVAKLRRPRFSSGLTLSCVTDQKISGPVRKKGKNRWCVLSGTGLYCFKSSSPEEEAEARFNLQLYTVGLRAEKDSILDLAHLVTGKTVSLTLANADTARLWYAHLTNAIQDARSCNLIGQPSSSSNQEILTDESFRDSYGYFERQSLLRSERDALKNATVAISRKSKQLPEVAKATQWVSMDDLTLSTGKTARRPLMAYSSHVKHVMSIPSHAIVHPTMAGYLYLYLQSSKFLKIWAVLKDAWLYLYNEDNDSMTSDIIDLPSHVVRRVHGSDIHTTRGQLHKHQQLMFTISDDRGSDRVVLMGETDQDTLSWMEQVRAQTRQKSSTLEGLNLERGSVVASRHRLKQSVKSQDRWHQHQADHHRQRLLREILSQNKVRQQDTQVVQDDTSENPLLAKQKADIVSRYEKTNSEEELERIRQMTLLNRRRMSAQVKMDVLQKTIVSKSKRRLKRIGSVEEATMEEQIRSLNAKLAGITAEMSRKNTLKTRRLQALEEKMDLELQVLQQNDKLQRYRRVAQSALCDEGGALAEFEETDGGGCDVASHGGLHQDESIGGKCHCDGVKPELSRGGHDDTISLSNDSGISVSMSPKGRQRLLPTLPDDRANDSRQPTTKASPGRESHTRPRSTSETKRNDAGRPFIQRKVSAGSRLLPDIRQLTSDRSKTRWREDSKSAVVRSASSPTMVDSETLTDETLKSTGRSSTGRSSPGQSSPGRSSPGRSPPSRSSTGRSLTGQSSPGWSSTGRSSTGRLSTGQSSPGWSSTGRSSTGRSSPGQSSTGQSLTGRSSPGQSSPGQSSPGWSPTGRSSTGRSSPGQLSPGRSLTGQSSTGRSSPVCPMKSPDENANTKSNSNGCGSRQCQGSIVHESKGHESSRGHNETTDHRDFPAEDEIDPEIMRDINDFEMMSRRALRHAGWNFR